MGVMANAYVLGLAANQLFGWVREYRRAAQLGREVQNRPAAPPHPPPPQQPQQPQNNIRPPPPPPQPQLNRVPFVAQPQGNRNQQLANVFLDMLRQQQQEPLENVNLSKSLKLKQQGTAVNRREPP